MKILVPVQLVPDLVEELVIAEDGKHLDADATHWIVNEFDDHAIEQAVLLKESHGGEVTIIAPDFEGVDDTLYQAAAKGVDRVIKMTGDLQGKLNTHALSRLISTYLLAKSEKPDLILTGVQTHDSLDGSLGPQLAALLDLPFVDCVAHVEIENGQEVVVRKEFPAGLVADWVVKLPAVLGIQAANTPPRYVPISKIRQAMKTSKIASEEAGEINAEGEVNREKMYLPDATQRAIMLEGAAESIADQMVSLFKEMGIL